MTISWDVADKICARIASGETLRASIYGLYDASGALRYIGKANNPEERLNRHMRDAPRRRTPVYDWINKHGRPVMRVLEADCQDWREAERRLIAKARADGERLLNLADGGNEPYCSPENRLAAANAGADKRRKDPAEEMAHQFLKRIGYVISDMRKRGDSEKAGELMRAVGRIKKRFNGNAAALCCAINANRAARAS